MRKEWFLFWTNLNPLHPRIHCAKFGWIWSSGSPKDALCQVWLKLAQWFWRGFLNFFTVFGLFHNYLPLEKGRALQLNKLESPLPKDDLCQVKLKLPSGSGQEDFVLESPLPKDALCQIWLKLAQWFLKRWKFERWSEKLTWAFSSGELKSVFLAASCQYFISFLQGHKSTKVSFLSICNTCTM